MKHDLIIFLKENHKTVSYVLLETFLGKTKKVESNSTPELIWNILKKIWNVTFSRRK